MRTCILLYKNILCKNPYKSEKWLAEALRAAYGFGRGPDLPLVFL